VLIPVLIGVAGVAVVAIAYVNRNPLSGQTAVRQALPYVATLAVVVAAAVGLGFAFTNDHSVAGANGPENHGTVGRVP
jgi:hypothetical protein